jgi:hypothetical protein
MGDLKEEQHGQEQASSRIKLISSEPSRDIADGCVVRYRCQRQYNSERGVG